MGQWKQGTDSIATVNLEFNVGVGDDLLSILRRGVKANGVVGGQAAITFVGMIFSQVATFLAVYLIAKNLGPVGLGRYQLFMSVTLVASFVAKLGLDEGLSYYLPRQHSRPGTTGVIVIAIGVAVGLSLALGGLVAVLGPTLNLLVFRLPGFDLDLPFLVVLLPCYVLLLLSTAALRGLGRSDVRAYISYFGVGGVFAAGLLLLSRSTVGLGEILSLRSLVLLMMGLLGLLVVATSGPVSFRGVTKGQLKELWKISILMAPVGLLQYLADQPFIDLIVVGRVATPDAVGVYSAASRLGALALLPLNAISIVFGPALSRALGNSNQEMLRKLYADGSKWLAHLSILIASLLAVFAPEMMALFGTDFGVGTGIMRVFAVGYGATAVMGLNSVLLLALGLQRTELSMSGLSVVLMMVSDVLLGFLFGAIGVAVATVGSLCCVGVLRYQIIRKKIFVPPVFNRGLMISAASCLLIGFGIRFLLDWVSRDLPGIFRIALGGLLVTSTYACLGFWFQKRSARARL